MKLLIACLILCSSAYCQTIHVEDDNIIYKGKVRTKDMPSSELMMRAQSALKDILENDVAIVSNDTSITTRGAMKLQTPHRVIRTLHYAILFQPDSNGYHYRIDNISVTEKVRGEKSKTVPGKILLKGLGESGKVATETEKLLNEIDMRLQEIIARLKQEIG